MENIRPMLAGNAAKYTEKKTRIWSRAAAQNANAGIAEEKLPGL
jgi:hypothetical protein